jgi:lysozyme
MKINQATIDLVKRWEGFRAKAYLCPAGIWTIGYGTTSSAGVGINVKPGMIITEKDADRYLRLGLDKFARQIRPSIKVPINENQFGAFLSLAYNIGPGSFRGSSALRKFNDGDIKGAADAIKLWNKATVNGKRQVLQGLVNRRNDEVVLFHTKPGDMAAVDAPVLGGGFWAWLIGLFK